MAPRSAWVSAALRNHFTDVHTRFFNADPGRSDPNDPLRCRFGVFPLLCVNFPSDGPVNCVPHTDYKNPAGGICAVVPYGAFRGGLNAELQKVEDAHAARRYL